MADNHTQETRSYNMSRICSKNTKPEIIVCKFLFAEGFRYRKNDKRLPGCPDIVLRKYKTAIFVNGCFWHGHAECSYFVWPKSNIDYWKIKINGNIDRDNKTYSQLSKLGWNIIVVWECQLKKDKRESTLLELIGKIKQNADVGGAEVEQGELDS
jgi:DNA mismatch endonuclease Vsr